MEVLAISLANDKKNRFNSAHFRYPAIARVLWNSSRAISVQNCKSFLPPRYGA